MTVGRRERRRGPHSGALALVRPLVLPQPEKGRVPEQPVRCDLAELHLADVPRLDPRRRRRFGDRFARRRLGARRDRHAVAGRVAPDVRREQLDELAEHRVVHAGTDAPDVAQAPFHELGELQRADERARPLRLRIADDDEIAGAIGLDLEPVRRSPTGVGAVRPLGDDPLEPELRHLAEHQLPFARDRLEPAHRTE
jgi:hypothetical protein